jgi:hypothetical protein
MDGIDVGLAEAEETGGMGRSGRSRTTVQEVATPRSGGRAARERG